jgi:hypothetical protein
LASLEKPEYLVWDIGVSGFCRFREGSGEELKREDLKIHKHLKHGEGK